MIDNSRPDGGYWPVVGTGLAYGDQMVIPVDYDRESERPARPWDIWRAGDVYLWAYQDRNGAIVIRDVTEAVLVNHPGGF